MNPDLYWITAPWRGRLAIATRPRGGEWLEDEVRGWRWTGIDLVISVLESDEVAQLELLDESKTADANGIRFISFPIPDRGVPASVPASLSLMATVSSALGEGRNVAVPLPSRHWTLRSYRGRNSGGSSNCPRRRLLPAECYS